MKMTNRVCLLCALILSAFTAVGADSPPNDAFIKAVSALPAEQQAGAVSAKLKELNPTFDGQENHKIEGGVVTTLAFSSVGVTDISPVKALAWLRTLTITPPMLNQKGSLADLSPLKGMQLTWLWCHNNPISDLTPLKNMPLTVLSFGGTQVSDLSPLTGMKLQVLSLNDTVVSDIAALEGMPLTVLWCNNTKIGDLTPAKTMPLREIKCDFVAERDAAVLRGIRTLAKINDLPAATFWMRVGPVAQTVTATTTPRGRGTGPTTTTPTSPAITAQPSGGTVSAKEQIRRFVEKMKELNPEFDGEVKHAIEAGKVVELEFLTVHVTNISPVRDFASLKRLLCSSMAPDGQRLLGQGMLADLAPLKGLRLDELNLCANKVNDLSPLAGMKLKKLYCTHNQIINLSPLRGMPLVQLTVGYNKELADISPLAGMKLDHLQIHQTQVRDLTPLHGMPLVHLHCGDARVTDFSALKGMKLFFFDCRGTGLTDMSLLKGMPLSDLRCDFDPQRDAKILRSIKTLNTINRLPAAEFWKRVAAGEAPQAK